MDAILCAIFHFLFFFQFLRTNSHLCSNFVLNAQISSFVPLCFKIIII